MDRDVYTVHESATVGDVLRVLVDKKASGVPIINDEKRVVGFISDGDIMKFIAKQDPRIIDMTSFITVWYDTCLLYTSPSCFLLGLRARVS